MHIVTNLDKNTNDITLEYTNENQFCDKKTK